MTIANAKNLLIFLGLLFLFGCADSQTINITCPTSISILQSLNCTIMTVGASAVKQVTLNYGDGDADTFNLSAIMPYQYYFNYTLTSSNSSNMTKNLTAAPTGVTYYLLNTEIKYNGALQSVTVYALSKGQIKIGVFMMSGCPSTASSDTCASVLDSIVNSGNPYCPNTTLVANIIQMNITKTGYNTVNINNYLVSKGAMLMITTTAQIAIDPVTNSTYSDVYLTYPSSCYLSMIGVNKRLMLSFVYQPTLLFPFSHSYSWPSVYTIMAQISTTTAIQSLDASVNPVCQLFVTYCNVPEIYIYNRHKYLTNPRTVTRNSLFSVKSLTIYDCNITFSEYKIWEIHLVNETTTDIIKTVNMSSNPTMKQAEVVIQPLTLLYGVYQFVYNVSLSAETVDGFESSPPVQLSTYVSVVPTGISVYVFPQRLRLINRGTEESILLDPLTYSFDLDNITDTTTLTYTYSCEVEYNGVSLGLVQTIAPTTTVITYSAGNGTCFSSSNGYKFDSTGNVLTIEPGALAYNPDYLYKFTVSTTNMGAIYSQTFYIGITPYSSLPSLTISCKFPNLCQAYQTYQRINPNTQLIINGACLSGCNSTDPSFTSILYFRISMNVGTPTSPNWVLYNDTMGLISGQNTTQLTIYSSFFSNFSSTTLYYKVEYVAEVYTNGNLSAVGLSGIMVKINEPPSGGECYLNAYNGTALSTTFTLTCLDWKDPDSNVSIALYEYFARYPSSTTRMMLASNNIGVLTMQFPPGLDADSNYLEISVDIIDEGSGVSQYVFVDYVKVIPDLTQAHSLVSQLNNFDANSTFIQQLRGGNIQTCAQNVIGLSSMIKDLPVPASLASSPNGSAEFDNQKAIARQLLMQSVKNVSIASLSSAKVISTLIKSVTENVGEINRDTASMATDVLSTISDTLTTVTGDSSVEDLQHAAHGAILGLGNLIYSLNGPLNNRATYLASDMSSSSNASNTTTTSDYVSDQKNQSLYNSQNAKNLFNTIATVTASHMSVNQTYQISSDTIKFNLSNVVASEIPSTVSLSFGSIVAPTFCEMRGLNGSNCSETVVTQKTVELANPFYGKNSDSGTSSVALSNQISLGYYDADQSEISIKDLTTPIKLTINRNLTGQTIETFKIMNVTTMNATNRTEFVTYGLTLTGQSLSIHLNVKPENQSMGYLVLFKFGETPVLNSTMTSFDYWMLRCPQDLVTVGSDDFYRYFLKMSEVNKYNGYFGYSIRELGDNELATYCSGSNSTPTTPPIRDGKFEFRYEISIMLFTSGCYYYDHDTSSWLSDGVEVLETTTQYETQCETTHLTDFAGGFIVLPPTIDFNHVFANASFTQNLAIYITCILIITLYVLLAIWARCMDRRDVQRMGVTPLSDNMPGDKYFYEIIVFTGSRKDAATDSRVNFILSGDAGETKIRSMEDNKRRIFRRAGIDSFVMTNKKPLGDLTYLRIWHDNSGKGTNASWFLKSVIVHDLQTRQMYNFICEEWLAVEKGDGAIERFLPVSGDKQKTEFNYMMAKQTKSKLSDGHMWFSVFIRPTQSSFSRLDRLTCCFVLLCISMLVNILYYGVDKSPSAAGLKIGPFNLTPQQIGIGIMSNLIVFPPSLLLVQLFRRSRRRVSRSAQLKATVDKIKEDNKKHAQVYGSFTNFNSESRMDMFRASSAQSNYDQQNNGQYAIMAEEPQAPKEPPKKKKKPLTFPWWCKIIAYILSFIFAAVSIFFIIMQGISLGNDQVTKWLTSVAVSFLTSILLTQPLQVIILTFLFITICRKQTDDLETDSDDDQKPLNDDETWLHKPTDPNFSDQNFLKNKCTPYDEEELQEIRLRRMQEIKIKKILREIFFYTMFLWILYIVSFLNNDSNLALYQQTMKKYFLNPNLNTQFGNIGTPNDVWNWLNSGLLPLLNADSYNGNPVGLSQYVYDHSSVMIGYPLVRQLRVENNSCTVNSKFSDSIGFCEPDYGVFNREKRYFTYNWNQSMPSGVSVNDQNVLNAFAYTSSDDIDSYPSMGIYTSYLGGGYVYKMQGTQTQISTNLTYLQQLNWIDRQTRAIFVEFSLYNPSINVFCYITFLIEFMPTGNIDLTARFDPLKLFQTTGSAATFILACNILFLAFIVYFMFKEGQSLYKQRLRYFLNFWVYIEIMIIGFSWAAFAMYLYRMYAADKLLDYIKTNYQSTTTTKVINLQYLSFMNESLTFCLAFCAALATIKFLKLLRFNRRVSMLGDTLRYCMKDLISFSFIFLIVYLAFVQLMYLTFNEKTSGYSSFVHSMETCFQIIMGKFSVAPMIEANELLGPLYFSCYNIFVVFILIGMFITIISNGFTAVRVAAKNNPEDPEKDANVVDYVVDMFKAFVPFLSSNKVSSKQMPSARYKDTIAQFPDTVDNLTKHLDKLIAEHKEATYLSHDLSKGMAHHDQDRH